jgi:hypothetical protein
MNQRWYEAFRGLTLMMAAWMALATLATAATKEPSLWGECDRTGPTQLVG